MARKKRVYEDDDGRTVADMSGVERPNLLFFRLPPERKKPEGSAAGGDSEERPWEKTELTREERRAVMLGAVRAAALIAVTFIVIFGIVIFLMTRMG